MSEISCGLWLAIILLSAYDQWPSSARLLLPKASVRPRSRARNLEYCSRRAAGYSREAAVHGDPGAHALDKTRSDFCGIRSRRLDQQPCANADSAGMR